MKAGRVAKDFRWRFARRPRLNLTTERLLLNSNHVFIIPERRDLHVLDRVPPEADIKSLGLVIAVFLRSLTKHWDGKLIAVIVSGNDGDGAAALCFIKDVVASAD
jgi:two-component system chemotaxis response regulator CheB